MRSKSQKSTFGELATFDLLTKGISSTLESHPLSVRAAERNLDNELAVRLLKALLLVKHVKELKTSVSNLRVLMSSRLDQRLTQLRKDVEESLRLLENQIYIQRNGEYWKFLTDDEKGRRAGDQEHRAAVLTTRVGGNTSSFLV